MKITLYSNDPSKGNFLSNKKLFDLINLECIIRSKALQRFQCGKEFSQRVEK